MVQQVPITIYLEENPNPNSLKFVLNRTLLPDGISYDFPTLESAGKSPLAQDLLKREEVTRVFYMNNFVTITKTDASNWYEIRDEIKQLISNYFNENKPLLLEDISDETFDESDSEIVKKIKGILDEYIRPAVEQDGGAISFHSLNEGVVKVLLQGSCSGCPSSTITLKAGIENLLKRMLPDDIQSVEALDG
ncbi:MAG: NifU family protein [Cyclobacteriaceae bacterium]|nr:NifU family protein [Cyclobacteriaceae bacterium]